MVNLIYIYIYIYKDFESDIWLGKFEDFSLGLIFGLIFFRFDYNLPTCNYNLQNKKESGSIWCGEFSQKITCLKEHFLTNILEYPTVGVFWKRDFNHQPQLASSIYPFIFGHLCGVISPHNDPRGAHLVRISHLFF